MKQTKAVFNDRTHAYEKNDPYCIDHISLFNTLTTEQKEQVKSLIHIKYYDHGETIYSPGQTADALYILKSGTLRIYRLADTGKEQLIRMVPEGEFTGELALFKKGIYEAFAEAKTDCCIWAIKHSDFRQLLIQYPEISIKMLSTISERLGSSEQQTAWATTETVKERLLHFLISLVHSQEKEPIVELNMAKKDLASYLGTTSESLSRELARLVKERVIEEVAYGKIKLMNVYP